MLNKENIENIYELSPMQKNMYYNYISKPNSKAYFEQMNFRIKYNFDINLIKECFEKLVDNHDVLRTVFVEKNDEILQVVLKKRNVDFTYKDISNKKCPISFLKMLKEKDELKLFNLKTDNLLRLSVFKINESEYEFVWNFHHIILDGWSSSLLMKGFFNLYFGIYAEEVDEIPQYNEYIRWINNKDKDEADEFWSMYLAGYESELSFEFINKEVDLDYLKDSHLITIKKESFEKIKDISIKNSVTINSIISTVWGILLSKYSDNMDSVFGSVVSGRNLEVEGINSMVGLFINTIPVRVKYDSNTKFNELVYNVQQNANLSERYHYLNLVDIQSKINKNIINHILVFENYPVYDVLSEIKNNHKIDNKSFEIKNLEVKEQTSYDLNVIVIANEELKVYFEYNSATRC